MTLNAENRKLVKVYPKIIIIEKNSSRLSSSIKRHAGAKELHQSPIGYNEEEERDKLRALKIFVSNDCSSSFLFPLFNKLPDTLPFDLHPNLSFW